MTFLLASFAVRGNSRGVGGDWGEGKVVWGDERPTSRCMKPCDGGGVKGGAAEARVTACDTASTAPYFAGDSWLGFSTMPANLLSCTGLEGGSSWREITWRAGEQSGSRCVMPGDDGGVKGDTERIVWRVVERLSSRCLMLGEGGGVECRIPRVIAGEKLAFEHDSCDDPAGISEGEIWGGEAVGGGNKAGVCADIAGHDGGEHARVPKEGKAVECIGADADGCTRFPGVSMAFFVWEASICRWSFEFEEDLSGQRLHSCGYWKRNAACN